MGRIEFVIDEQRRLVLTSMEGRIGELDIAEYHSKLATDPVFDPKFDQLIDATLVAAFALTEEQIRLLANRQLFSQASRRAIVAIQDHVYGVARMAAVHHEKFSEVQVFRSMGEAMRWLERKEEHEERRSDETRESPGGEGRRGRAGTRG